MAVPLKPKKAGQLGGRDENLGLLEETSDVPTSADVVGKLSSVEGKERGEGEVPKQRAKYHQASTSGSSMESAQSPTSGTNSGGKLGEYLNSSSSVETDSAMNDGISTDSSHASSHALSPRSPPETYASGSSPLVRAHSGGLPFNNTSSSASSSRTDLTSPRALSPTLSSSRRPKQPKRLQISTIPTDSQESSSSSPSPHRESSKPLSASSQHHHSLSADRDHNQTPNSSDEDAYDDRSTWLARVQHEHPVIQDIRQRVRPLARTLNFARTFHVKPDFPVEDILTGAVPPVKRSLNEIAIGLAMQHLHSVGFAKSVGAIHLELDHMAMRPLYALEEAVSAPDLLEDDVNNDSSQMKPDGKAHRKTHKTLADFGRESSFPGGRSSTKDFINTSFHKDQAFFERDRRESPLVTVIRSAMRRAQSIYDLAIADRSSIASLSETQLEELLSSLGMLDDDDDIADDVDIWEEGPDPEEDLNAPRSSLSRAPNSRHTRGESLSIYMSPNSTPMTTGNASSNASSSSVSSVPSVPSNPVSSPSSSSNGQAATSKTAPANNQTPANASSSGSAASPGNRGDYSSLGSILPPTPVPAASAKVPATATRGNGRTAADGSPVASGASSPANAGASGPSQRPKDSTTAGSPVNGGTTLKTEAAVSPGSSAHTGTHAPLALHKSTGSPSHTVSSSAQGASAAVSASTNVDGFKDRKLVYDMWADVEDEEERPIRAATLNKLVEVATSSKLSDLNFLPTFLLTYKSFATPRRLFEKLRQRFNVPMTLAESQGMTPEQFREFVALPIRLRVISFLKRWIQDYPEDIDRSLLAEMKKFVEKLSQTEPGLKLIAASITTTLDKIGTHIASQSASGSSLYNTVSVMGGHGFSFQALMHGFSPYASASALVLTQSQSTGLSGLGSRSNPMVSNRKVTIPPGTPPVPKVPKMIFHPSLSLYQIDQEEFARQLTIMDSHVFISVKPSELLNQSWNKPKLKHLAPNVLKMVNMFNQLSHAISAQILQGPKPKDRAKIIEWWIKVAEHCKNLSNYHGLMAVVSGINSGPTVRLKASRREVSKSLLDQLASYEAIFESDGSFSAYRSTLLSSAPPLIPYLGIHLTDLTFIEEGNKDMQGHLINFAKRRLLYQTISGLQNFQQTGYNLQSVRQIQDIIANLKAGEVRDLFKLSLMREPRERS